jgi:hypothetical protein
MDFFRLAGFSEKISIMLVAMTLPGCGGFVGVVPEGMFEILTIESSPLFTNISRGSTAWQRH